LKNNRFTQSFLQAASNQTSSLSHYYSAYYVQTVLQMTRTRQGSFTFPPFRFMKYLYHRLAALSMAAASLSSCSRTAYTFNAQTPAYLGTAQSVVAPSAPATVPVVAAAVPGTRAVVASPAIAAAPGAVASPRVTARLIQATEVTTLAATTAQAQPAKPTLVQRLALKKVLKQLAKAETRQQNTASVTKTAAKGPGITAGIVGLAALIVGLIVSSGFLIVVGSIVLVVGIVLYVLSIL
jgi:hypothetical protein